MPVWHMLKTGQTYTDLGPDYFDRINHDRVRCHHVRRLAELGYEVTFKRLPEAA
jgi:hypothetical protein